MKSYQKLAVGLFAALMLFALPGCEEESDGGDTVIARVSLNGWNLTPVRGEVPYTGSIEGPQYTGTIAWQTGDGMPHSGVFADSTVYKAVVTLTARSGCKFSETAAFTYDGAVTIDTVSFTGLTLTVIIVFPATGAGDGGSTSTIVSALSLDSLISAPVRNATPDTSINAAQYTGTIAWQTVDGVAHNGPFAASTIYKAVLNLTAASGYTFNGAGDFTCQGASSLEQSNNTGAAIKITITFPATEADNTPNTGVDIGNPSVKLYLNGSASPLAEGGTTAIGSAGEGTFTVSIAAGSYSAIVWYLNGAVAAQGAAKTSIALPKRNAGTFLVIVEATPTGGDKNTGSHCFTVQ
jgi:hypothetical protein